MSEWKTVFESEYVKWVANYDYGSNEIVLRKMFQASNPYGIRRVDWTYSQDPGDSVILTVNEAKAFAKFIDDSVSK